MALVIIEKENRCAFYQNDEAGFIALHIVNGQLDEDVHDMYEIYENHARNWKYCALSLQDRI